MAAAAIWLLAGCATPERLESRDGPVPSGVDLSGNWVIRSDQREDERRLNEAIRRTDGMKDDELFTELSRQSANPSRRSSRRSRGGLVYVFLETGSTLKVSQTPHGLFISFDRAVVEEYRFGENRMVSVGQAQAQRVTGWDGGQLVIETLDRNSMKLIERYRLIDDGRTLERTITLRSNEGERESLVQLFDRQR